MKKLIIILITVYCGINIYAGDTTYYNAIRQSLKIAYSAYIPKNYQQLANVCERIALVKSHEWLPYYYCAYAYINMGYMEKNADNKDKLCDKAEQFLDSAMRIKPNEPENYIIKALIYYGRMEVNPMIRGVLYFPKSVNALDEAEKLDPKNPRVFYLRGRSTMSMPTFMGGGKEAAYPILQKALILFSEYKTQSNIHPNWGKEHAQILLNECKAEINAKK